MALLKKVNGSTLMETLVATVLIVIVFMMASLTFNQLFGNSIKNNTHGINNEIRKLAYLSQHQQIQLPYSTQYKDWDISINANASSTAIGILEINATHKRTQKSIRHDVYFTR